MISKFPQFCRCNYPSWSVICPPPEDKQMGLWLSPCFSDTLAKQINGDGFHLQISPRTRTTSN